MAVRGRKLKIYVLKGLPGSGKSTRAKEILKADRFSMRVNKDLLREMLQFKAWSQATERYVVEMEYVLVRQLLVEGRNVIVDDTNLNATHIFKYNEIAAAFNAEVEIIEINTPIDECIRRDNERKHAGERYVGPDVIKNMAFRFGYLKQLNPCVIFDLDGTLADVRHRRHFVQGDNKDWMAFFKAAVNDAPRVDIIDKMRQYKELGYDVIICSACPAEYREMRENWLRVNNAVWDRFLMRNTGDYRPDVEVKRDFLNDYLDKEMVEKVFDDRKVVVDFWRSQGLDVEDVSLPGEGDF
jgi:predicted kinase